MKWGIRWRCCNRSVISQESMWRRCRPATFQFYFWISENKMLNRHVKNYMEMFLKRFKILDVPKRYNITIFLRMLIFLRMEYVVLARTVSAKISCSCSWRENRPFSQISERAYRRNHDFFRIFRADVRKHGVLAVWNG